MIHLRVLHLAAALVLATALGACTTSTRTTETTGQYLDDAGITTRVKAAIFGDASLKTIEIGVETFKGTVQLSGFVSNEGVKAQAGRVAAGVSGVTGVRNSLVVK